MQLTLAWVMQSSRFSNTMRKTSRFFRKLGSSSKASTADSAFRVIANFFASRRPRRAPPLSALPAHQQPAASPTTTPALLFPSRRSPSPTPKSCPPKESTLVPSSPLLLEKVQSILPSARLAVSQTSRNPSPTPSRRRTRRSALRPAATVDEGASASALLQDLYSSENAERASRKALRRRTG